MTPYTPFTLQAVSPVEGCVLGNVPALGSPSEVCVQPCASVAYGSFKLLKISASDFDTVGMRR